MKSTAWAALLLTPGIAFAAQEPGEDPLVREARELSRDLARVRGLSLQRPADVGVYSREQLSEFIRRETQREIDMERFAREEKALKFFGLIPRDMNLYETYMTLYTEQIAGFYHTKSKQLKLIREEGSTLDEEGRMHLVHELTHAAQDQNFDLETFASGVQNEDDLASALQAVTEGDATLVMFRHRSPEMADRMIRLSTQLPPSLPYPPYIVETLVFSYTYGARFSLAAFQAVGEDWERFNRLYREPPLSTEQILHPEKFTGATIDYPIHIELPDLAAELPGGDEAWDRTYSNVWGELVSGLLFVTFRVERRNNALRLVRGWGGDRFEVYERASDGALFSAWFSRWDDEEASERIFNALPGVLEAKHEGEERTTQEPDRVVYSTPDGEARILRRGRDVLLLEGIPRRTGRIEDAVWRDLWAARLTGVSRLPYRYACRTHTEVQDCYSRTCPDCDERLSPLPRETRALEEPY